MSLGIPSEEIYVPDTSALVEGAVSRLVREGRIKGIIIIHRASIAELEHQANKGRATGFAGLEEIKRLRKLSNEGIIRVEISGDKPKTIDIKNLGSEAIDAMIRDYAYELGATLITGDKVQAEVAETMGIPVIFIQPTIETRLILEEFFDSITMSVHLKEGVPPIAKKGRPGDWVYETIRDKPLTRRDLEEIANNIIEQAKSRPDGFIEIDRFGSTIVQLGTYRIIITRPPLSDGWEITAVRPLKKLSLEDYNLPAKLIQRLNERAEGILIAGAPGMGKTTFAQALAEYYMRQGKVVKTIESPRDMNLPPEITQYSKNYADLGELHDILLLSRPDYTVFDEMRSDEDFKLYADLRLAGIGMIGVVHATTPIDAIQRFIGRVELGMIPSLIDTVIFIKNGYVDKVYEVRMTVKLPTGLKEAELSRPVVEVRDFLTDELEYEIYTFGEQTVVVPVKRFYERAGLGLLDRLARRVQQMLPGAEIRVENNSILVIIPRNLIKTYNKKIRRLRKIEDRYNVPIRVRIA
ncbi:ATPase, PilT family [Staphylothermus marinus F1]|uniref:ATPase, PilT family n=1 Tax=Staphylothermus marinus (strain ATCC 43588 / DSM 3639 / JCM 9404 / F1) TaxID=399550 RepID=A3DKU7_STAMF|nr:PINc/VapC family ATPase [Staphylothermus marinus]ABN69257.1 ATPase, PilT family [Staphylothermus marinus F1]